MIKAYILEYVMNKFCPYAIIAFLVFWSIGFDNFVPYVVMGLIYYIDRFSFKTGHAVAVCEERGFDLHS